MALLAATGCTGNLNRSIEPHGETLPDLSPLAESTPSSPLPTVPGAWQPMPLDRAAWPLLIVEVPDAQVEVNPTGVWPVATMPGRLVPAGAMPSAETATEVTADGMPLLTEAVLDPFRSAAALVLSPIGLVLRPPWAIEREPQTTFELGRQRIDGTEPPRLIPPTAPAPAEPQS